MITQQYSTGDIIKSRILTAIRKDGGMRYQIATVLDIDTYSWDGDDLPMLKVEDEFGNIQEVWADTVFYHERNEDD